MEDFDRQKMKVVSINDRPRKIDEALAAVDEKRRNEMLEILEKFRADVQSGKIKEFCATSLDSNNEAKIHCYVDDVAVGIGLFEIGKNILLNQYNPYNREE